MKAMIRIAPSLAALMLFSLESLARVGLTSYFSPSSSSTLSGLFRTLASSTASWRVKLPVISAPPEILSSTPGALRTTPSSTMANCPPPFFAISPVMLAKRFVPSGVKLMFILKPIPDSFWIGKACLMISPAASGRFSTGSQEIDVSPVSGLVTSCGRYV